MLHVSRGITQQAPRSAITGKTPDSTLLSRLDGDEITQPFAKDCISFLTISWSHCGAKSLTVQSPGVSYCKDCGNLPEVLKAAVAHTAEHLGVDTHKTKAIPQDSFCQHRLVQFQERSHHCQDMRVHHCYGEALKSFNSPFFLLVFLLSRGHHLTAAHLSAQKTTATRQPCHCLATCCSLFSSVPSPASC